jgi:putative flippase GtrA
MKNMQKISIEMICESHSFVKFAIVGLGSATIFFLVMWLFESVLKVHYLTTTSLAYICAMSFHFFMNRSFSFGAATEKLDDQIFRYLLVAVINYLMMMMVVSICVERLSLSTYAGVCISTIFSVSVGYSK